ncbi:MAG: hypothetical protein PHF29_07975 [Candidatus Riflebacteria bacterium]|nr:hypothetical protein [Candidatus Riflebacteria bacterium]
MYYNEADRNGVTLLEIIIAFFILCIAAISASGLISYGHKATKADYRQGESLQILVDRLNYLSSLPYSKLKAEIDKAGNTNVDIKSDFNGIKFGTAVASGVNKYSITATLKYQSVTFDYLKQLKFPNKEYKPDDPRTWIFEDRTKKSETFNAATGEYAFAVIKITVKVRPVEGDRKTEREVAAITFVSNTEG